MVVRDSYALGFRPEVHPLVKAAKHLQSDTEARAQAKQLVKLGLEPESSTRPPPGRSRRWAKAKVTGVPWWNFSQSARFASFISAYLDEPLNQLLYRVDLITVTRRGHIGSPIQSKQFRYAQGFVWDALRAQGALGAMCFLEAVPKPGLTANACCGLEGCPSCSGTGRVRRAHLHSHWVVVSAKGNKYDYSWFHKVRGLREVGLANIDFQQCRSTTAAITSYVTKYASKGENASRALLESYCLPHCAVMYGGFRGLVSISKKAFTTERLEGPPQLLHVVDYTCGTSSSTLLYPELVVLNRFVIYDHFRLKALDVHPCRVVYWLKKAWKQRRKTYSGYFPRYSTAWVTDEKAY